MKLTLVGTGIKLPHVDETALRYNFANAYLQAYLQAGPLTAAGLVVDRVDLPFSLDDPRFDDASVARVVSTKPDVVGLSCYSWDLEAQLQLATRIREEIPEALVVLGGPSATFQARELMARVAAVDAVVRGEGERTLAELLAAPDREFGHIAGLTWRTRQGEVVEQPDRPVIADLAELASPLLTGVLVPPRQNMMLEFSRGCIYRCAYCAWRIQGGGVRYVPEERVSREVAWAHDHGYEHAFIIDSAINNDQNRLDVLARAVSQADPNGDVAFSYFINYAFVNAQQVKSLKAIRPHEITVGLESVNQAALRAAARKPLDTVQFARALDLLSQVGPVTVSVMLGMPGDDLDGFRRTLDFIAQQADRPGAQRIRSARVHWMLIAPGSHLHKHAARHGIRLAPSGIPYVLGTDTFPEQDLIRALQVLHEHPRSDLFIWEDAEPVKMLGADLPRMISAGGDHLGGRAPRRITDSDVLRAIRPLEPGRPLRRGWRVGPIVRQHGWPVVVLEGPGDRRISLQIRARDAEPHPYARTATFDLVWIASEESGEPRPEEQRLVAAFAELLRTNDQPKASP